MFPLLNSANSISFLKRGIFIPLFFIMLFYTFQFFYERDILLYQLAIPKHFFQYMPFSHFSFYPWLPFIFNYFALMFKMPFLANLFHLFFAFSTIYLISKSIVDKKTARFIAFLFITLQPALRFSYVAYSDFYLTFFSFGSVLFAIKGFKENYKLNFLLSAILCGLGLNTKYNMLVFAVLLYFFVFWLSYYSQKSIKKAFYDTLFYIFISVSMFFPFMLKNYLLTGSPLYPFFTDVFPSTNPYAFQNVSHFVFRKYFFGENLFQILATPVMVFFYGIENNIQYFDGVLNPFFVIFPIIAVFAIKDRLTTALFLFGWLYNYFVLFLEPVSARFLLPSVPIFAYISGQYLSKVNLSEKRLWLIFLPFLVFNFYFGGKHLVDKDKWQYLTGIISKDEFLEKKCPDFRSIKFINEHTPKNAKIFYLFSGQRTYYLERDFIYDSFNDGRLFKRLFNGSKDESEFLQRLKNEGITHLFIRKDLFESFLSDNFDTKDLEIIGKFFEKKTKLLFSDGPFLVVSLND